MNRIDALCVLLGCDDYVDLLVIGIFVSMVILTYIPSITVKDIKLFQKYVIKILSYLLNILSIGWTFIVKRRKKKKKMNYNNKIIVYGDEISL